ncbi:TIGR03560 family F420-dependent LLM class oxidoreductase [Nocardioides sp. DS6]|uniref:TIGR03560 family F420-dependent LLM class oxidoreductase n=1 Tax=Nocardioides eburneus TaxID=3231482 RepID=A0ABV3SZJ5_9ACTN
MRLRVLLEPRHGGSYDEMLGLARATEEAGLDAFFRSDHYLGVDEADRSYEPTDSWATLAGLARDTSRIRLGTLVTAGTFRLPGVLAVTVATVDAMSGGRVELGLGTGWYDREHAAFGVPFPPLKERFDRLEEQLAIVSGLWGMAPGETFDFEGEHFRIDGAANPPRPAQAGGPPIVIGGGGPKRTPAIAARFATEYNGAFPEGIADRFTRFREACRRIGRDPDEAHLSAVLPVACGTTPAQAQRRFEQIGTEPLREEAVVGDVDAVAERVRELAKVGADTVYFHLYDVDDLDHVHLLGQVAESV